MSSNFRQGPGRLITEGVVAVTGHRPDKLGGYDRGNPLRTWIRERLSESLSNINPKRCISGMAIGVDQDFADVCVDLRIPFIAAIPFEGQEKLWPPSSQEYYRELLKKAMLRKVISEGGYHASKMQRRNEWMVDNCQILIAVWDGSGGGTGNCVKYAEKIGREIVRINPKEYKG